MKYRYNEELIPHLYEGIYIVDKQRKIIFWNKASERITGYKAEEVINSYCYNNILQHIDESGKQLCLDGCPLQKTLDTGEMREAHVYLKHKEGHRVPVMVRSLPIYDDEKKIVAAVEAFTDERFLKNVFRENINLKNELHTDTLTKVSNRRYFDFHIAKAIDEAEMFEHKFGILMIDIDHFKKVNDTHGHLVGDEVLKIIARSLTTNLGKSDLVSRWGGEEFIAIIDIDNFEDLYTLSERLRNIVRKSTYKLNDQESISVTISIGGTLYQAGDKQSDLIKRADQNMYFAKQNGRNQTKLS